MTTILELYGEPAESRSADWERIARAETCPWTASKCAKQRKSNPDQTIGTCSLRSSTGTDVIICPHRFLAGHQIFSDCVHLLTGHVPSNDLLVIPEFKMPGGSVDFVLVSVSNGRVIDFVGIEIQGVDSTGSIWPERQRFLKAHGLTVDVPDPKACNFNWKMTAKTILMQMHHKVGAFASMDRPLVLVIQDCLLRYLQRAFDTAHLRDPAVLDDPLQIHAYCLDDDGGTRLGMRLSNRLSTDSNGVAIALGQPPSEDLDRTEVIETLTSSLARGVALQFDPERSR